MEDQAWGFSKQRDWLAGGHVSPFLARPADRSMDPLLPKNQAGPPLTDASRPPHPGAPPRPFSTLCLPSTTGEMPSGTSCSPRRQTPPPPCQAVMRLPGPPSRSGSGQGLLGLISPGTPPRWCPSAADTCRAPPDHRGPLASRLSQQGHGRPLLPCLPLQSSLQTRGRPAAPPSLDAQGFLLVESHLTSSPPSSAAAKSRYPRPPVFGGPGPALRTRESLSFASAFWSSTSGSLPLPSSSTPARPPPPSRTRLHAHTQMLTLA